MTDNNNQHTNNNTFYNILGGDTGIEKLVRDHTSFYQSSRRARETEYLKRILKNVRTERQLGSEFTIRMQDLFHTHNRYFASWIFFNRVKYRDIVAQVKKNSNSQL